MEVGTAKDFLANDFDGGSDYLALFESDGLFAFAVVELVVEGVGFINTGGDGEDGGGCEAGLIDAVGVALAGVGDGADDVVHGVRFVLFHILDFDPSTASWGVVVLGIDDGDVQIAPCVFIAG